MIGNLRSSFANRCKILGLHDHGETLLSGRGLERWVFVHVVFLITKLRGFFQIIKVQILEISSQRNLNAWQLGQSLLAALLLFEYSFNWFWRLLDINGLVHHEGVCKILVFAVFRLKIKAPLGNLLL